MSNRNFLEELHKVTYNKETNKPLQPLRESRTGHGQAPIDFNLYGIFILKILCYLEFRGSSRG